MTKSRNSYLELFVRLHRDRKFLGDAREERLWRWRRRLVRRFAWAVPNEEALTILVKLSPLVEIGAGMGYWASMVRARGGEVEAYDIRGQSKDMVRKGGTEKAGLYGEGWTLFLCWPPFGSTMASEALATFRGSIFAYAGEPEGGCTGDRGFHLMLEDGWQCTAECALPQWSGIHDGFRIYRRRESFDERRFSP